MNEWLRKREYISPTIVDELIKSMVKTILRDTISEVTSAQWYAIIADEATQVLSKYLCQFVGVIIAMKFMRTSSAWRMTIHHEVKEFLIKCPLSISWCGGQAYNGVSNMSSIRNGAQALFKQDKPKALYVHCLVHSLNLLLLDFLVQLIKFSPKRLNLFESLKSDVTLNAGETLPSLRTLCPTCWIVRHGTIASILKITKYC